MQATINDILAYMRSHGGVWADWYVGIADDPKKRLFVDHAVNEGGIWIHSGDLGDHSTARAVEKYFLDCGCDGGPGGGSNLTKFVYAYKKVYTTVR